MKLCLIALSYLCAPFVNPGLSIGPLGVFWKNQKKFFLKNYLCFCSLRVNCPFSFMVFPSSMSFPPPYYMSPTRSNAFNIFFFKFRYSFTSIKILQKKVLKMLIKVNNYLDSLRLTSKKSDSLFILLHK